jgi:phosphate-selective porin
MTPTPSQVRSLCSSVSLALILSISSVARAQVRPPGPISPPSSSGPAVAQAPAPAPAPAPGAPMPPPPAAPMPPPAPPVEAAPPPPPPVEAAPPAAIPAAPAPAPEAAPALTGEPLAGWSDGTAFLRSPDNAFILFPSGRLQIDGYAFKSDIASGVPKHSFLLRRARLEMSGWVDQLVFWTIQGDFAAGVPAAAAPVTPSYLSTTDDYIAIAPWNNLAIFQVGQYDAPFTLENRTSDKYFDFMERSLTVRAFGIPDNKQIGAMIHGWNDPRNFFYSIGYFNGDGQNFKNVDNNVDLMMRAWVAPISFMGEGPLHDATIGGSFWTGNRSNTLPLPNQTTQGGFTFLSFSQFNLVNGTTTTPYQFRQVGRQYSAAGELNVPFDHKFGARYEIVWKHNPLSADSIATSGAGTIQGGADLKGYSMYGQLWFWVLGDDRIIGDQQGLEPFPRYKKFGIRPPQQGVMLVTRLEYLNEKLTLDPDAAALMLPSSAIGKTTVTSWELGVNYWRSKRFRATFNYVLNHFGGDTPFITGLKGNHTEHEFAARLGIAL